MVAKRESGEAFRQESSRFGHPKVEGGEVFLWGPTNKCRTGLEGEEVSGSHVISTKFPHH